MFNPGQQVWDATKQSWFTIDESMIKRLQGMDEKLWKNRFLKDEPKTETKETPKSSKPKKS